VPDGAVVAAETGLKSLLSFRMMMSNKATNLELEIRIQSMALNCLHNMMNLFAGSQIRALISIEWFFQLAINHPLGRNCAHVSFNYFKEFILNLIISKFSNFFPFNFNSKCKEIIWGLLNMNMF
jgi:hypothetical protein